MKCIRKLCKLFTGQMKPSHTTGKENQRKEQKKVFMISQFFNIKIQNKKQDNRQKQQGQETGKYGVNKDCIQCSHIQPEANQFIYRWPFGGHGVRFNENIKSIQSSSIQTFKESKNILLEKEKQIQVKKQEKIKQDSLFDLNLSQIHDSVSKVQIESDQRTKNNNRVKKDDRSVVQAQEGNMIKRDAGIQRSISQKQIIKQTPSESMQTNWVEQLELPMQSYKNKVIQTDKDDKHRRNALKRKVISLIISSHIPGSKPRSQRINIDEQSKKKITHTQSRLVMESE